MNDNNRYNSSMVNMFYPDLLDEFAFRETKKFHQNAVFFLPKKNYKGSFNSRLSSYLSEVQLKIPLIENDMLTISLGKNDFKNLGSGTDFSKGLNAQEIATLLGNSLGIDLRNNHRKFASAGGLFPIYVIFINFEDTDGIPRGAYFYDGIQNVLKMINKMDNDYVEKSLKLDGALTGKQLLVYVGDLKRVFYKYQYAGYKHIFIESGLQMQTIREQGRLMSDDFRDLPISGFRHNALMKSLNLSTEDLIISVVQWIGKK